jgi:hypothetical protein
MNTKTHFEKIVELHETENSTLVRELKIRVLDPVTAITKKGYPITYLVWEYINPLQETWGWKERKKPMFTDEATLIVKNGPYEEDCLYRVTAQKNSDDFWKWTEIEKIGDNQDIEEVK